MRFALLCQFRSSWRTPRGHALPRCSTDVPSLRGEGHTERHESRWLVAPPMLLSLPCGFFALLQHNTAPVFAWGFGACQVGLVPDSGLDASSQYPSLGSFTTPAARLMVETRGVPQGFLSYYHVMPSSRPSHRRDALAPGHHPPDGYPFFASIGSPGG